MSDTEQIIECLPASPIAKRDIVLIPTDGSEFSDYAIEVYLQTFHRPENHVVFMHSTEYKSVSSPGVAMAVAGCPFTFTEKLKIEEDRAKLVIANCEAMMLEKNIDGEAYHVRGEAGPGIITVANEKHADYIVIGCRGKGTVRRTLTGSVTDYVTHHAKIPVIVARHRDHNHHHHHHGHHLPAHLKR